MPCYPMVFIGHQNARPDAHDMRFKPLHNIQIEAQLPDPEDDQSPCNDLYLRFYSIHVRTTKSIKAADVTIEVLIKVEPPRP